MLQKELEMDSDERNGPLPVPTDFGFWYGSRRQTGNASEEIK